MMLESDQILKVSFFKTVDKLMTLFVLFKDVTSDFLLFLQ